MRGRELLYKIGLASPEYIEAADARPARGKRVRTVWAAAAACLAAAVLALALLLPRAPSELPMLTVGDASSGGMGFEGYMAYDVSELVNANPWSEELSLTRLPVFRNAVTYGENNEFAEEANLDAMLSLLHDVAGRLGLDAERLDISAFPQNGPEQPLSEAGPDLYSIQADAEGVDINVDRYLTASIRFDPSLPLPEGYNFNHHSPYDDIAAAAEYLLAEYSGILNMDDPQLNIYGGDYSIYSEQYYHIAFYDAGGDIVERILNYNLNFVHFGCNSAGELSIIRIYGPDLSGKVGDYPIITAEEAEELLLAGSYITNCGYEMPGVECVADVELVYRSSAYDEYFMPYYRFYVELPQLEREDALKTYAAYYVPAVAGEYISDMPVWDGSFN